MVKKAWIFVLLLLTSVVAIAALHDPTKPPASKGSAISAIIITSQKSEVLIGGEYLTIGDNFSGGKIIAIHPHSVVVQEGQQKRTIHVFKPVVKNDQLEK